LPSDRGALPAQPVEVEARALGGVGRILQFAGDVARRDQNADAPQIVLLRHRRVLRQGTGYSAAWAAAAPSDSSSRPAPSPRPDAPTARRPAQRVAWFDVTTGRPVACSISAMRSMVCRLVQEMKML